MLYGSNSREITNRLQWRKREETKRPIPTKITELSFLSLPRPPRKNRTTSKSTPTKSRRTMPTDGPRPRNRGPPAQSPKWWVITTCLGLLNYNKLNWKMKKIFFLIICKRRVWLFFLSFCIKNVCILGGKKLLFSSVFLVLGFLFIQLMHRVWSKCKCTWVIKCIISCFQSDIRSLLTQKKRGGADTITVSDLPLSTLILQHWDTCTWLIMQSLF